MALYPPIVASSMPAFNIADGKVTGTTIFAYVDLNEKIEEVEVNDLEVTH